MRVKEAVKQMERVMDESQLVFEYLLKEKNDKDHASY